MKYNYKKIILLAILFIFASGIGGIVFERVILPQMSGWPVLRDLKIFDPRGQVVIVRREEIHIEGEINTGEVIQKARGALIKVYVADGELAGAKPRVALSGFVAANDGLVLIPGKSVKRGQDVNVVLENGTVFFGVILYIDPLSGIAFVKIPTRDLPVLSEAKSQDKKPGEQLLALSLEEGQGIRAQSVGLLGTSIAKPSLSVIHDLTAFESTLELDSGRVQLDLGSVILDKDGSLVGFVSFAKGQSVALRVDDVQLVLDNFLDHQSQDIKWPQMQLSYLILGPVEAGLLGLPKHNGIFIRQGEKSLAPGDFVYEIDGREISAEDSFQTKLFAKQPGEKVRLKLLRNGLDTEVAITL